jgi:hypothetical protein
VISGFRNTYLIFNEESTDDYFRVADVWVLIPRAPKSDCFRIADYSSRISRLHLRAEEGRRWGTLFALLIGSNVGEAWLTQDEVHRHLRVKTRGIE